MDREIARQMANILAPFRNNFPERTCVSEGEPKGPSRASDVAEAPIAVAPSNVRFGSLADIAARISGMSALPLKADIHQRGFDVR